MHDVFLSFVIKHVNKKSLLLAPNPHRFIRVSRLLSLGAE